MEAAFSMLSDCYRNGYMETGGILVGPMSVSRVVTDAIPSSVFAERAQATYYQSVEDVAFLNQQLREHQKRGRDFKGYYHQHPSGITRPSQGDLATCYEILTDSNYKINNKLMMIIVTDSSDCSALPIFAYNVSLDDSNIPVVTELPIKIMPKTCIMECIVDCFEEEPQQTGGRYESDDYRHTIEKTEGVEDREFDETLRPEKERIDNRDLDGVEERA